MFLPEESFLEIKKAFNPPKPLEPVDKDNIIQNMNSLYELEDYIKEKIYDTKYPGVLPNINPNLLFSEQESYEDVEENFEIMKENDFNDDSNSLELIQDKKYKIKSNTNDIIKFDNDIFSTNDEDEFASIEIINEEKAEGNNHSWIFVSEKDDIKIYYKISKIKDEENKELDLITFFVETLINISSSKLNNYLNDINFRKEFDSLYSEAKVLEENNDVINNIKIKDLYFYMKMPIFFTDRDFVVRKKIWEDYGNKKGCYLLHMKSIENEDYPEKQNPIRGKFIIRTGYICPYDDGEGEKCKLYLATCIDMKMNFGSSMVIKKASDGQRQWVVNLIKNINKHEK